MFLQCLWNVFRRTKYRALWDGDSEWRAWDVFISPFDSQDVVSSLLQDIADVVLHVSHVFDQDFLAGGLRTVNTHQEHVLPSFTAVNSERGFLADEGLAESRASTADPAGRRAGGASHGIHHQT